MTEKEFEDLIQQAKIKYPIGTVFNSTGGANNCTIVNHDFLKGYDKDLCINAQRNGYKNLSKVTLADHGGVKWAEIVFTPTPVVVNNYQIY